MFFFSLRGPFLTVRYYYSVACYSPLGLPTEESNEEGVSQRRWVGGGRSVGGGEFFFLSLLQSFCFVLLEFLLVPCFCFA